MVEKIKAFFSNKVVIIVESVIIALASAGLIFGGITVEEVAQLPALTLGVITAFVAVVTFIKGLLK